MNLLFRTNPVLRPQDDYGWYRLEESGWTPCSPSGNSPDIPVAAAIPRGFSTIRVDGTCCVLLRDRGRLSLTIGVPTRRREVGPGGRPVGDVAFLQAETEADERLLARLAIETFSTEDVQGLGDPARGLGAAVDAVWASASFGPLAEIAGGVQDATDGEALPHESWIHPRADFAERSAVAARIAATVRTKEPFLLALTDRTPDEALQCLPEFKGPYRIFSSRVERAEQVVSEQTVAERAATLMPSCLKERLRLTCDRAAPGERRVFACLETVFMPVSFLTLGALLLVPVLGRLGVSVPEWFRGAAMTVLVSAAIGYVTNWIAIEMLFRPYHPTLRHPFAWLTCGYWRQGLVPKNKNQIAEVLGEQVATRLLQPEKIADDLCSMAEGVLRDGRVIASIRDGVQHLIAAHDGEIAAFLAPRIEAALVSEVDRLVTVKKIEGFWTEHIEPKLRAPSTHAARSSDEMPIVFFSRAA